MSDEEDSEYVRYVSAEVLKLLAVRQTRSTAHSRGASGNSSSREIHPKAVHSTTSKSKAKRKHHSKQPEEEPDSGVQVVSSPRCTVSRQASTPVDKNVASCAPPENTTEGDYVIIDTPADRPQTADRPHTLPLKKKKHSSSKRKSSPAMAVGAPDPGMCSPCARLSSPDERQLCGSYPPGPAQRRKRVSEYLMEHCGIIFIHWGNAVLDLQYFSFSPSCWFHVWLLVLPSVLYNVLFSQKNSLRWLVCAGYYLATLCHMI